MEGVSEKQTLDVKTGVPGVEWGSKMVGAAIKTLADPLMWGGAVAGFIAGIALGYGWSKITHRKKK